ncbi:MAG TPA: dihydroxyacetone kinase subunit DhaL [Actinomycetota bacterium]|nr:dihydroxyacetone kinase subunit DhaL [Actinomycetota bacterium]
MTAAAVPWARLLPEPRREAARIVDAACVRGWLGEVAARLEAERDFLTQLDAAIGDADHGVNMHRGFTAVMARVADAEAATPGQLLKVAGRTFVSTVGGAAGPLYGTAFLQAGEVLGDHQTFGPRLLLEALRASLEGVQRVGAASVGDKTMVDALTPALGAYELELRMGGSLETAASGAREAAAEGMRGTIPLQARKGRASYLGPRSVGHQDPGATSTALMFAALERAVLADRSQRFAAGARRPVTGP